MKLGRLILGTCVALLFLISGNSLKAQYIVKQINYDIPFSYSLIPENVEFDGPQDEAKFVLTIPVSKLKEAALADGREIQEETVTIYIDGDNFTVETGSEDMGKVTMVSDTKTGAVSIIMWAQKKVMYVTADDMAKMEEQSKAAAEKMMENVSSEIREQMKVEMEKNMSASKYDLKPTGKKMDLYGFACDEYRAVTDDESIAIWVANDTFGIVGQIDRISKKYEELNKSSEDDEADPWRLVPGKIPVQFRTYRYSTMEEPSLNIQTITSIENRKPSADKFKVPGENEGFMKISMMDMMKQMMPDEG